MVHPTPLMTIIFLTILPLSQLSKSKISTIWLICISALILPFLPADLISKWLIALILGLAPIMIQKSEDILSQYLLVFICWLSIVIFLVTDALLFYVFYEALLIPMFFLIGYFGGRNAKLQAIYEFFIYTLLGSFALLLGFQMVYQEFQSQNYTTFSFQLSKPQDLQQGSCLFLGFAVKVPLIPVHLWLPKAHVEAPTIISIYLAAILLKMGIYGYIRFQQSSCPEFQGKYRSLIMTIAIIGAQFTAILCFTATFDIKKIIAYSSISHMNLAILALFSNEMVGTTIGFYFLISHGILSAGQFLLVGCLYDRYHTRIISYYKGLVQQLPLFSCFQVVIILGNIAFPLTSGFLSEIMTFLSQIISQPITGILGSLAIIFTPIYSLILVSKILYGNWSTHLIPSADLSRLEVNQITPLVQATLFIGIYPKIQLFEG